MTHETINLPRSSCRTRDQIRYRASTIQPGSRRVLRSIPHRESLMAPMKQWTCQPTNGPHFQSHIRSRLRKTTTM